MLDFDRDIYKVMKQWKIDCDNGYKVALVLNGARQIGKTHCLKKFTSANFSKVYYIDFFEQWARNCAKSLENSSFDTHRIIEELFPGFKDTTDSVVVFDEVQEYSHIYNLIRPVNRKMLCRLIVSGSFLGRTLNREFLTPVGDTKTVRMYGLSFSEFMDAIDMKELYEDTDLFGGSDAESYESLRKAFNLYCRIGGYPKVLERFLSTRDYESIDNMLEELVGIICDETGRYLGEIQDLAKLRRLLTGVASLLVREKRGKLKFSSELGRIVEDTNKRSITNALHWLWQSGVLEPCGRVNDCNPSDITPESIFFFSDLGVASHLHKRVSLQDTNTYGAICENFAYSCIRDMKGLTSKEPNFATFGDGELDYLFFVHSGGKLVPVGVEVKAEKPSEILL